MKNAMKKKMKKWDVMNLPIHTVPNVLLWQRQHTVLKLRNVRNWRPIVGNRISPHILWPAEKEPCKPYTVTGASFSLLTSIFEHSFLLLPSSLPSVSSLVSSLFSSFLKHCSLFSVLCSPFSVLSLLCSSKAMLCSSYTARAVQI